MMNSSPKFETPTQPSVAAYQMLNDEVETNRIRVKLRQEVEKQFAEANRKHFLKEQLNLIQKVSVRPCAADQR
jgi:ATP-dependent Lon protease